MTKARARALARRVHTGSRGNTQLHLAATSGDPHAVMQLLRRLPCRTQVHALAFAEQRADPHSHPIC